MTAPFQILSSLTLPYKTIWSWYWKHRQVTTKKKNCTVPFIQKEKMICGTVILSFILKVQTQPQSQIWLLTSLLAHTNCFEYAYLHILVEKACVHACKVLFLEMWCHVFDILECDTMQCGSHQNITMHNSVIVVSIAAERLVEPRFCGSEHAHSSSGTIGRIVF
jgi:hypothetical protein